MSFGHGMSTYAYDDEGRKLSPSKLKAKLQRELEGQRRRKALWGDYDPSAYRRRD